MNTHRMHLRSLRFKQIANGTKTIEVRLNDPKRQKLTIGDSIQVINNDIPDNTITKTVKDISKYPSLAELFKNISLVDAGYPVDSSSEEATLDTSQYYDPSEEKQFGVIAILLS